MSEVKIIEIPRECRFAELGCRSPPTGLYYFPGGCICFKDPVQALCDQHAYKATPIDGMSKIATLETEGSVLHDGSDRH